MKILFIGDIVGEPGREATREILSELKREYSPDLVIANGENVSHGKGMSSDHMGEMMKMGIDFFTSGNHIWQQKSLFPRLDEKDPSVIRPANFPPDNPGRGWRIVETSMMKRLLIINLQGRVFMHKDYDCPFRAADKILEEVSHEHLDGVLVDFHAEATSEKVALGHYLDGRVSAALGTHTHIPTADARILDGGTGYISDVGMVGLKDGVIGVNKEEILKSFVSQMPVKHQIATEGTVTFGAVYLEIEDGKTTKIEQILREAEL